MPHFALALGEVKHSLTIEKIAETVNARFLLPMHRLLQSVVATVVRMRYR
jgi:hypothetical protein